MYDQTQKASYVHNIRKFMSLKNDAVVRTMSVLEFDFCFHLEYNPNVKSFISQPDSLYYLFNGRRCRYTSDFLVKGLNGQSSLIEVKHSSKINNPDFRARFAEKKKTAIECYGLGLRLVTDKQIRINPILNNLKLLHRYSGFHTVTEVEKFVLKYIQRNKNVQLRDMSEVLGLSEQETIISSLCWLSSGKIQTDLKGSEFGLDNYVWG
ncbi:TnsA endonuclease N-terminal domain-containing protein [Vibrio sp. dhg]|uniref:TnsA endonuclease N-terminal domain-containing protein n=1 Tax=Vibrio sp. dhg TaxID=2163016 RepID=UPI000E554A27|nr:TnsA endonuclease N-terminal domain-containing protein [Vibrio sp. dhg]AXT73705.1 endonuclease [Vibrio sp. dhg]